MASEAASVSLGSPKEATKLVSLGQQGVAGENGLGDAISLVRGRLPAAEFRIVHDVVMKQRRDVEHFHGRGQGIDIGRRIAKQPGRKNGQQRTQSFSPVPQNIPRDVNYGGRKGFGRLGQRYVDTGLFLGERCGK